VTSRNLSSCQSSSSMNFSPSCKSCNMRLSNFSLMVVKESWRLEISFSSSSTLYLQYWLSSWIFLMKSLNSYSFTLFKALPMEVASRSLTNQLWYHLIYKWWAYGMFFSSTWMRMNLLHCSVFKSNNCTCLKLNETWRWR
jgi:hypothetical protein